MAPILFVSSLLGGEFKIYDKMYISNPIEVMFIG
jgi:hypothetical protein